MKSSTQRSEQPGGPSRTPWRALLWSVVLHGFAFGLLLPEFGTSGRQVPPDRILQGHLSLPASPTSETPAAVAAPATLTPAPIRAVAPVAGQMRQPGGRVEPQELPTVATVAMAAALSASGPDAAGLRQYRLALAGEARHFKRYPEAVRSEGLSGTVEVRVTVMRDQPLAELSRSSGHVLLDAAALDMLQRAAERARLPESLRGQAFSVLLPVVYEAEN